MIYVCVVYIHTSINWRLVDNLDESISNLVKPSHNSHQWVRKLHPTYRESTINNWIKTEFWMVSVEYPSRYSVLNTCLPLSCCWIQWILSYFGIWFPAVVEAYDSGWSVSFQFLFSAFLRFSIREIPYSKILICVLLLGVESGLLLFRL